MQIRTAAHQSPALHLLYTKAHMRTTAHEFPAVHLHYLRGRTKVSLPGPKIKKPSFGRPKSCHRLTCPGIDLGAPHPRVLLLELLSRNCQSSVDALVDTNPSSTPAPLDSTITSPVSAPKQQKGKAIDYRSSATALGIKRNQQRLAQANEHDVTILGESLAYLPSSIGNYLPRPVAGPDDSFSPPPSLLEALTSVSTFDVPVPKKP
jgi:hypothetical protein